MGLLQEKRTMLAVLGAMGLILIGRQIISHWNLRTSSPSLGQASLGQSTAASTSSNDGAQKKKLRHTVERQQVFMDIGPFGEHPGGRIVFELYNDVVPATTENFRRLCVGDAGSTHEGIYRTYKGSKFHRIIPKFVVQGGDFTRGDGTGGASIYGRPFADENFVLKHDAPGLLSMANSGVNTNESQFFITLAAFPHLDGHHVVFGHVKSGFDIVKAMEGYGSQGGTPTANITVMETGQLPTA
eukprot:jgi/Botrbrau1/11539/Bobra.0393s0017.1